jgi:hypothetical protein
MRNQVHKQFPSIITSTLDKFSAPLHKWRRDFILETLILFMSIPGRICFMQLGQYSNYGEQRFRQQFEKRFDFMEFNTQLIHENLSPRRAIAIDPSYISMSGKKTSYMGGFWSGCAQCVKRGLELMGLAAIDIENRIALHIETVQTPPTKTLSQTFQSLTDWYLYVIKQRAQRLLEISNIVVADAFFSKHPFVEGITKQGFHLVSRLPNNANLRYLYKGEQRKGRGRPKQYDGKIELKSLKEGHFTHFLYNGQDCYHAIVNSVALERNILVVVERLVENNKVIQRIIFSTDIQALPKDILDIYHTRFQIEFQFRDAKQATGLTHCKARSFNKLYAHFNFSLTAVNIAKIAHWKRSRGTKEPFSITDNKLMLHNQLMVQLFIRKFGINPNSKKNQKRV